MASIKKYQLGDSGENTIHLLGLICDEKEYRLSWMLNKALTINLGRSENLKYQNKKLPTSQEFHCYTDLEAYGFVRLIRNLSNEGIKIPAYKQFDYLFITSLLPDHWITDIRNIKNIRGAFELDPSEIQDLIGP